MWRRLKWSKLHLLVVLMGAVLLTGCAGHERVMVPPKADLQGAESVAVLYFDNETREPVVPYEVEENIAQRLSTYYRVADQAEVDSAMTRLGLRRGMVPTRDEIIRLGRLLNVDAVITGEVIFYFDDVSQSEAYMIEADLENELFRWEISQTTKALVSFTGRVINTRSGAIMYSRRVQGEGESISKSDLGWLKKDKKPDPFWYPSISRFDIPSVRSQAVRDAGDQFSAELLPTYVWRKVQN
ncbi:MAG: hypothetical protein GX331_05295 [Firmicutes bacterium]|nr:hypothetical protein [Bacillota bacterium]